MQIPTFIKKDQNMLEVLLFIIEQKFHMLNKYFVWTGFELQKYACIVFLIITCMLANAQMYLITAFYQLMKKIYGHVVCFNNITA